MMFLLAMTLGLLSACASPSQPQPSLPATVIPPRLAGATPIPSPTSSPVPEVAILSIRGHTLGMTNAVIAHAPPGATCTLTYVQPPGTPAPADTFNPAVADAKGEVRWVWTLSPRTPVGPASVTVSCGGKSVTSSFFVELPSVE
jgi:hypothetical protein